MEATGKSAGMKVVIVGGVAGGASCAARLRRLNETAEIIMVERGPYVSYANCGLPYHVGGVIQKEASLMVADANTFRSHFAVDARTGCEAIKISPDKKTVELRDVATGQVTTAVSYTHLDVYKRQRLIPLQPAHAVGLLLLSGCLLYTSRCV